jgi:phosphoribosylformylglycinamidine synthase PurS subunit
MKAKVTITPRRVVLDPQGKAVLGSLHSLGFPEVGEVRVGRFIEVELTGDRETAAKRVEAMCRELLANTLIEDYRFEIEG